MEAQTDGRSRRDVDGRRADGDLRTHEEWSLAGQPHPSSSTQTGREDLLAAMVDLAERLTMAPDLMTSAKVVAEAAVALVPGVQDASVSLAGRGVGIETLASAGSLPELTDAAQVQCGEGPCIQAAWVDKVARLDDTETDTTWPEFSRRALALGVRSMLSFQLSLPRGDEDDDRIGAINTYAMHPHAFGAESERIGRILAVHASVGIGSAEREEQLRAALDSRDLIGQAKGLIMAQQQVSADHAFALMVRQARDTNTRLRDLAATLVSGHRPG
jgi:ANTAR domain